MLKYKIAVGHPGMGFGGSEARVMNLLELLQKNYDVTLVTTNNIDLSVWNSFYGTAVEPRKITIRHAPVFPGMYNNLRYAGLRGACYQRFCRQIGKEYDLCISAYNLTDWGGGRQLHFIADFVWDRELADRFDPLPQQGGHLIHRNNCIRKMYMSFCRIIAGKSVSFQEILQKGTVVANSQWSADLIAEKYGTHCRTVIFPPVGTEFGAKSFKMKKADFVSIGRIAPEKRIELQIKIIEKIRKKGFETCLHLIGDCGEDPYGRRIRSLAADKPWVIMEGRQSGKRKMELLTSCRYALHTRPYEAFGITVAEFVKAGCIPFIPDTGGQTEIVPYPELQFRTEQEAIEKIVSVLESQTRQKDLLTKLKARAELFSVKHFQQEALKFIQKILGEK